MTAFPKSGRLESPTYLEWVRSRPCCFCGARPRSEAHHFPPKGMGGASVDDSRTIPVCRACHKRCGGEVVVFPRSGERGLPIPSEQQTPAVDATLRRFIMEAQPAEVEAFYDDVLQWRASIGR